MPTYALPMPVIPGGVAFPTARPPWLDERLYPFESHFVGVEGNRIHYIDAGSGPVLLFLHPGVGWSFTFRDVITELRDHFRCIALDLPGYGLSPARPSFWHTLTGDSRLLERFIETLGLSDVTLFGQDITGSVALGVVARRPERFRAVIVGPGFAWPLDEYPGIERMVRLVGSPAARQLGVSTNFFLEYYLSAITKASGEHFSAAEKRAYRGPMADRSVRRFPHDLFASAVRSRDYLDDLERRLSALDTLPALLLFGETDRLVKLGWLERFERIFARHRSVVLMGAHHFPQEYDASAVASEIRDWWSDVVAHTPAEAVSARQAVSSS